MIRFVLQPYLLACYCFAKAAVKKTEQWRISGTVAHTFIGPIMFILMGIYISVIGLYTKGLSGILVDWILPFVIFVPLGYLLFGWTEKTINRWEIPQQWEILQKWQRGLYIVFGTIIFLGGFALFFYLGVKFFAGYGLRH